MIQITIVFISQSALHSTVSSMRIPSVLLSLLLFSVLLQPSTAAGVDVYNASSQMAMSDAELKDWLFVETAAGSLFEENISISGFTSVAPLSLTWQMFDSRSEKTIMESGTLVNHTIGQHTTFTKVTDERWNWTIKIDAEGSLSCLCIVEFLALAEDGSSARAFTTLFTESSDGSLPPVGIVHTPNVHTVDDEILQIEGLLSDDSGPGLGLFLEVHLCMQKDCSLWQNWNSSGILPQNGAFTAVVNNWDEDGSFSATLNISNSGLDNWDDGIWMGCVIPYDAAVNRGQPMWFRVSMNREAPTASLIGPESAYETEEVLIDGSGSIDSGWGWQGLQYVWTISKDGNTRVPYSWEWQEGGILHLDSNLSGNYEIHLTVVDIGGKMNSTSHTVVVHNRAPIMQITLDSVLLQHEEVIRLPEKSSWSFDSSSSFDDELYTTGLTRIWYLDGDEIGTTAILELEKSMITGMHNLTLVLVDDDQSQVNMSIHLVLAGSSSDPMMNTASNSTPAWLPFILIITLLCAGAWLVNNQVKGNNSDLDLDEMPSWKAQKGLKKSEQDKM